MRREIIAGGLGCFIACASVVCFATGPVPTEVEVKFSKLLRNTKVTSVKPSPIKGLYEVSAGTNVFYYSPEGDGHLMFGQILDKNGTNLTASVMSDLQAKADNEREAKVAGLLKTLPLDNAVKIGNGQHTIIEFTDPDCPFCRKVDDFLSKRTDVTRYVFLFPLDQLHPKARAKSIYILSSKDKEKAFREVLSGKFDNGELPVSSEDISKHAKEAQLLAESMKHGQELGVQGTPMLFVNGKIVNGADFKRISQLLKL